MPVLAYLGQPRSGKSYSAVEHQIIPALKKGRHVVTNIPVKVDLLTTIYGGSITQLTTDEVLARDLPAKLPKGVVLILDEIWRRWPSGQKVNQVQIADLALLKEHGHNVDADGNTMQVVLVTQDAGDLASWVRKLVKFSFHHEKLDAIGMDKRFSIKVYKGCEPNPLSRDLVRDAVGTYKEDIYQFYTSATLSESSDLNVGDEVVMDKRTSVWGSWQMRALLLFIPVALFCGVYLLVYWFGMADRAKEKQARLNPELTRRVVAAPAPPLPSPAALQASSPGTDQPAALAAPPESSGPVLSGMWRIVGYMKNRDQDAPENPATWSSRSGYGTPYQEHSETRSDRWLDDVAILRSWGGTRLYPLSKCVQMEASRDYYCDIDGERVTTWSGQQGVSEAVGGAPTEKAKGAVDTGKPSEVPKISSSG